MTEYNPYESWYRVHVNELKDIVPLFNKDKPVISGWDTETTGIHLIKNKPFLIIFGWLVPGESYGRVFTFYPTQENMEIFFKLAKKTKMFVGHNASYDLSMMQNIGWKYDGDNIVENMVIARLSLEALSARMGGDKLGLKPLGVKYVHPLAAHSEHMVKEEITKLKAERVKILTAALKQFDHPTEEETKPWRKDTGKKTTSPYAKNNPDNVEWKTTPKKWNKGLVEDFLKDVTHDAEDLPQDVREVWETWQEEYPEPTYADVDREIMIKYAAEDVITMLEFFKKAVPVINERKQWDIVKRESKLIPIFTEMERSGMQVDQEYLENARVKMKAYIIKKRKEMYGLAGDIVNVGQDKTIIGVFRKNWNIRLVNCDKSVLEKIINDELGQEVRSGAKRYAKVIKELRTLEKWYSTYIVGIQRKSKFDGRLYMQLNQAGAVSGRVSSDGQQFPKSAIMDADGNELFHPRRMFVVDEGHYMYFLDYSQIELRSQANYTILVSGGDKNLCRAYMPFECTGTVKGKTGTYNFRDPEKRKYWQLEKFWTDENGDYWQPTDVHSQTTHAALGFLGYETVKKYEHYEYVGESEPFFGKIETKDRFKEIRGKGKTFNFARNYGVGLKGAMEQLNFPKFVAQALIDGYNDSFPGVITYQAAIEQQHWKNGYVKNMYGRRYYLSDLNRSYVLANYCIQGTCADMLKESIIKVYEYLQEVKAKTKMIMNIHDELIYKSPPGEEHIVKRCREIMEDHPWHLVPVVCDMEYTKTNWQDKEEIV